MDVHGKWWEAVHACLLWKCAKGRGSACARRACEALALPCADPEHRAGPGPDPERGAGARRTLQQVALAEAALTAARESLATIGSVLGGAPAPPAADKQEPAE